MSIRSSPPRPQAKWLRSSPPPRPALTPWELLALSAATAAAAASGPAAPQRWGPGGRAQGCVRRQSRIKSVVRSPILASAGSGSSGPPPLWSLWSLAKS
eukprot:1851664-Pyramimonas_sp.AAC.1